MIGKFIEIKTNFSLRHVRDLLWLVQEVHLRDPPNVLEKLHILTCKKICFLCNYVLQDDDFEWDAQKDELNRAKHGVSFYQAQVAFLAPKRLIAEDLEHSHTEKRYYCFGKVEEAIMTVRFTYRDNKIRIIGAGYWRKGKTIYEKA